VAGVETNISRALNARLVALTLSPVLPIAFAMQTYETGTSPYLQPTILPAPTEALTLSPLGANDHTGIYQISVWWPAQRLKTAAQDGSDPAFEVASQIVSHFKRGTKMVRETVTVWVDGPPSIAPAVQEPSWYQLPVSVPYRAFVPEL